MGSGFFISFEGIDGSGKSTQANLLSERLSKEGYSTILVREPGGTDISEKIRDILLDASNAEMTPITEFLLYAASRSQLVDEKIMPALASGKVVICDRFKDSSLAYQGFGRGVDKTFIQAVNRKATQKISPDVTFVIDTNVEPANLRSRWKTEFPDRLEEESTHFKKRVRNGYRKISEQVSERVVLIDGNSTIEQVQDQVWKITSKKLQRKTQMANE